MNSNSRNNNNDEFLAETKDLQNKTLEALAQTRRKVTETKQIGVQTLEKLGAQSKRVKQVEVDSVKLNETMNALERLLNKFALLSFQFGNRRKGRKELRKYETSEGKATRSIDKTRKNRNKESRRTCKRRKPRPCVAAEKENFRKLIPALPQESFLRDSSTHNRNKLISKDMVMKDQNHSDTTAIPLTESDLHALDQIRSTDRCIEVAIEELGAEVQELLTVSKKLGHTTRHQNIDRRFSNIGDNLQNATETVKLGNIRLKFFSKQGTRRREQRTKYI